MTDRRDGLRRYPALAFLAVAAALALILPSKLSNPQSQPSSLSEFAPVPGQSKGDSELQLGDASSGDLGFGIGKGGAGRPTPTPTPRPPGQRPPSQPPSKLKRCVQHPDGVKRQTEDPMSPPCVATFRGDNGGATWRGVTADAVNVTIFHNGACGSAKLTDWSAPDDPSASNTDREGRALTAFFNDRYQLYGRRLQAWGYCTNLDGTDLAAMRAYVQKGLSETTPFAAVSVTQYPAVPAEEAASSRVLTAAAAGFAADVYDRVAPYLVGVAPDLDGQARSLAAYVCSRLRGKAAVHSTDPVIAARERRFGLVYEESVQAPEFGVMKDRVIAQMNSQCSLDPRTRAIRTGSAQTSQPDASTAMADLRTNDITTVLVIMSGGGSGVMAQQAGTQQYFPEFVIAGAGPGARGPDRNSAARLNHPTAWKAAFGISFDVRRGDPRLQPWKQAVVERCPDCPESRDITPSLYDAWSMVMYGIQAAGAKLTPQAVDKGLRSIPARPSQDPLVPAAYFVPGGHTFIKDAMELWWDPSMTAAGENQPGCYRLTQAGRRNRTEDWRDEETGLFRDGPCQSNHYAV